MDRYVQWEETQLRKSSNTADGAAAMRAFTVDVGEWRIPAAAGRFTITMIWRCLYDGDARQNLGR